jgi:hypothetical protein
MSRGLPDYGNPDYIAAGQVSDPGALMLAVRGIASVDGLGRLFLIDTWDEGLTAWQTYGAGLVRPYVFTHMAEIAPCSILIPGYPGPGTPTIGLRRGVILAHPTRIGLEVGVLYSGTAQNLHLRMIYHDGIGVYTADVLIDQGNYIIQIRTPSGYETVYTTPLAVSATTWMSIKIVVDFATQTYVRMTVGQQVISLGQSVHLAGPSWYNGTVLISVDGEDVTNSEEENLIGHVFVTLDEP